MLLSERIQPEVKRSHIVGMTFDCDILDKAKLWGW